jgi:hypothetical protein
MGIARVGSAPQSETAVAKDAIGRGKLDYFVVYEVIMSLSDKSRSQEGKLNSSHDAVKLPQRAEFISSPE